jgi:hypothetical protein
MKACMDWGRRAASASLTALACAGCSLSVGPHTGIMTAHGTVNEGVKLDARFNPTEKPGVVAGIQSQAVTRLTGACPCAQSRTLLTVGYSSAAERTQSHRLGFEFFLLEGLGNMPTASGPVAYGFLSGAQIAVPIRLAARREAWEADEYAGSNFQLVPDVTAIGHLPLEGTDHELVGELSFNLSFRVHFYTAVLP